MIATATTQPLRAHRLWWPDDVPYEPQPGDILAYSGDSLVGWGIRIRTLSRFSHIGIVGRHGQKLLSFESTTLSQVPCVVQGRRVSGPQAMDPVERIDMYDGRVWVLRPERPLLNYEATVLSAYLHSCLGADYDTVEAVLSSTYILRLLRHGDPAKLFCSEYVLRALQECGRVSRRFDASAYHPGRLVHLLCEQLKLYYPPRRVVWHAS